MFLFVRDYKYYFTEVLLQSGIKEALSYHPEMFIGLLSRKQQKRVLNIDINHKRAALIQQVKQFDENNDGASKVVDLFIFYILTSTHFTSV